jgi:protein gp37
MENYYNWNPWHGCRRKSPGCKFCYMFVMDNTRGLDGSDIHKNLDIDKPLKQNRKGEYKLVPRGQVSTCMTSDFF